MEPSSTASDLAAGFLSGAASTLAVHPIDTVLTRFQATAYSSPSGTAAPPSAAAAAPAAAAFVEARTMAASLGPLSLWRGAPFLIGAAPLQNALLMAGYGAGRRWTSGGDASEEERMTAVFVGGAAGGLAQSFVASPAELWKVRRQVGDVVVRPRGGGGGGATAGLGATMLRDGIPHGVWFASYEWCKRALGGRGGDDGDDDPTPSTSPPSRDESWTVPLLSGAFAAAVAWGVGYPFDLVKTRIQAGTSDGVASAVRDVVGMDGRYDPATAIRRLYRGFGLKLARSVPASAIGFVVYEKAIGIIEGGIMG